ncbi:hypothetical protein VDG1235_2089 [Verrucomicrobiia bacterium DG1235]|nr:hypothetical protein VDG1235_2089 [Verrucomicrobiae bacterium DG1235]
MDWKTFISSLIDSLAWPIAVVAILVFFHREISRLIPRITKFKHKDTEIDFTRQVEELSQKEEIKTQRTEKKEDQLKAEFDHLVRLADVSPRSAVIESWRQLESSAAEALIALDPDFSAYGPKNPLEVSRILRKKEVLSESEFRDFNKLRKLRNQAAHADEFDLSGTPVEAYIDISLTMANHLKRKSTQPGSPYNSGQSLRD